MVIYLNCCACTRKVVRCCVPAHVGARASNLSAATLGGESFTDLFLLNDELTQPTRPGPRAAEEFERAGFKRIHNMLSVSAGRTNVKLCIPRAIASILPV